MRGDLTTTITTAFLGACVLGLAAYAFILLRAVLRAAQVVDEFARSHAAMIEGEE